MSKNSDNLFFCLHKYAQQDENFTTEAFVSVLRHLARHDSPAFILLLGRLTGGAFDLEGEHPSDFKIETQTTFSEGTPDIQITHPRFFILIEVKVEAGLGETQLVRYQKIIGNSPLDRKCLVLLTRCPPSESDAAQVNACVLWRHVAETLNSALRTTTEVISEFLMRQFVEFLKERGMWMELVDWELKGGVESLKALIAMFDGAIQLAKASEKIRAIRWDRIGYSFKVGDINCWSGVYFSNPTIAVYKAYDIPKGIEKVLGMGVAEKSHWLYKQELDSENVYFFSRTPESQQVFIEKFVADCCSAVLRINKNK